jgi:hypothetical protein
MHPPFERSSSFVNDDQTIALMAATLWSGFDIAPDVAVQNAVALFQKTKRFIEQSKETALLKDKFADIESDLKRR